MDKCPLSLPRNSPSMPDIQALQTDANLNRHALRPNKNIGIFAQES